MSSYRRLIMLGRSHDRGYVALKFAPRPASFVVLPLLLLVSMRAIAEVKLPSLFADHMVVQRGLPVHVWGMAARGEKVAVTFRGETQYTTADEL
jgi:hypothetical protein